MNSIINFSLKNKLAIWLLTIIVVAMGIYSGANMKQETLPDISTPLVSISTVYPGAAPEEVEEKVTKPIEQRVRSLSGVDVVVTSSMANVSMIQLEYTHETDMKAAVDDVKEAIENLEFPEGTEKPKISRLSFNAFPVMALSVTGDGKDLAQITKAVEESLLPDLEDIEGVAEVAITGQQVEEGILIFDQAKMQQYGLDEETVKGVIQSSNMSVPLGIYQFDDQERTIIVDGNITTLDDLKNLEIPVASGTADPRMAKVKLSDIAEIKITGEAETISKTNGKDSIGIQVTKAPDANTVEVIDEVYEVIAQFKKENKGVDVHSTMDQAEPIKKSVDTMLDKALYGGLFAVIVILLFLRSIRTTLISIISIPLSILMAILVIDQMDFSLNIMTLGAMTVAIGRVVDDSIVVIENIYRRMVLKEEKLKGAALIRSATKEMLIPILSSTVVTAAVYLPLATVTGPVGELFIPFALTMVFALFASLIVAITLVPAMAHSLFKNGGKQIEEERSRRKPGNLLANNYKKILNWSLNHKLITFASALVLLIASLFLIPHIGVTFIPDEQEKMMIITYTPAAGELRENVEKEAAKVEKYFLDKTNVETVQFTIGQPVLGFGSENSALFYVTYDKETPNFADEKKKVTDYLQSLPSEGDWKQQDFTGTSSNELTLYVYGNNRDQIEPVVEQVRKIMDKQAELENVDTSLSETYSQYSLVVNKEKMSNYGLTAGQIAMALSNVSQKEELTTIKKDGKEISISIDREKVTFKDRKDLENKPIMTPMGIPVPLKELVTIKEGESANTVSKRNGQIYAEVTGSITVDDVSKVSQRVMNEIDKLNLPSGVTINFGGVTEQINESFSQLGVAMLAAIAIVYFILVVTFHGGLAPFTILFSLPFTVIGSLVGLWLSNETINVSSLMGVLMLIGIVVTNAIVLIDRVIRKEEEGLTTREALLEAGATRLRPILMTALATIGALIPLAIGAEGEGSGLVSKGLGITVIGGLTSSTLLTLVIVPIVYEFLMKFRKKNRKQEELSTEVTTE